MRIVFYLLLLTHINVYSQDSTSDSCSFYIPNTYVPDGLQMKDRVREGWEIISDCEFEKFELKVFNRWGELLFESDSIDERWFPDRNVANGTYFYIIDARSTTGILVKRTGYVNIIQ